MLREHIKAIDISEAKKFAFIILIILLTDVAILLDVPVLRVIFGFLCYTILPGALILFILKLNKIGIAEKIVLSVGLSVSFLMLFGFFIDKLYFSLGYATPLSTVSLVVTFSAAMIMFCVIGYKTKTVGKRFIKTNFSEKKIVNSSITSRLHSVTELIQLKNWMQNINLSTSEKAFLIVPILFPALSIFGMYIMNTTDYNIILMFLLFLIPIYVAFVCFFNHKFPKRLYPVVIFSISISLLLLLSLRSNHIIGADVHTEYYYFKTIFSNLHWDIFGHSVLDACLVSSLLPSIYQSFLNVNSEYLYKILYPLLFSVTPLIVFVISKKHVGELYAFLASIFFMSQDIFLETTGSPRTNLAIFFFALAMMVFLSDGIDAVKKRMLFIVFMASCIVSHYSTTYIFFFIMLFSWFSIEMLTKRVTIKKGISLTLVLLFFSIIFFWYSQVTEVAFNKGVGFVEQTFLNLHNFFILESRCARTGSVLGESVLYGEEIAGIPHRIEFVFTWLTFVLIGVGIISMLKKYKEMVDIPGISHQKPDFLKTKFSIEYLVLTLMCAGLLVLMVAVPYVSAGYDVKRLYTMMTVILSVVFVLGGILLLKYLDQAFAVIRSKGKALKENTSHNHFRKYFFFLFLVKVFTEGKKVVGKAFFSNGRFDGKNTSQQTFKKSLTSKSVGGENALHVRAYLIILLVLIPQFMCVTGTMYEIFDVPREITLSSEGVSYDRLYIHDHWLIAREWLSSSEVVKGRLVNKQKTIGNMTEYLDMFDERNRVYDNGGSEVWK